MPTNVKINPQATAISKNGVVLNREHILENLGFDPHTPPDAWLAVIACGSNASALHPGDLQSLVNRGIIDKSKLDAGALNKLKTQ